VNKDRFAFMFASLVGRNVTLKLRTLTTYEGVLGGCNMEKGEYTVLLKFARELPSETRMSGPVHEQMLIPGKEIIAMSAVDVPEEGIDAQTAEEKARDFKTDSEINTRRFQSRGERQLESWADLKDDSAGHDQELETHSAGWSNEGDQFVTAKMMGVVSTYREDLYTTPLNTDSLTREQRERADRIAKEIEGGRNFSSQEEGGDGDEEAMFSAVIGTGGYKKSHPSETASSWRRSDDVRTANTRLNALNLEPATLRSGEPKPVPPKAMPSPPPRPASPTGVSEMKGINALNLEPAAVTRAAAWDNKYKAGTARAGPAPAVASQPTKKDFEIALAEIKSREQRMQPGKGKGKGAASPSDTSPKNKFSFNPNASTFTPGAPSGGNTLSIAITPGGSLSGTLKSANYDYYEPGPPMPPPPAMMMYPPPPFGMPMMPVPPMGPPPAFAPLVETAQMERSTVTETLSKFMEKSSRSSPSSSSTHSWAQKGEGANSYKDILGPLPPGIGPVMPPPPQMMMPPPQMMMPPPQMMGGYPMPGAYAPYYPAPHMGGGRRGYGFPPGGQGGYRYPRTQNSSPPQSEQ